jgi:hypothetical protein
VGAGDGDVDVYGAFIGLRAGAAHCEAGMNEKPRNRKKWRSKNETSTAPTAPEM